MKSPIVLWKSLANDSARRCHTSATLDIKTVQGRFKHEGLSFLTITLPSFGSGFQKSLDQGIVDPSLFGGFAFQRGLPRFLGGFLDLVFDRDCGVLLDVPSIDAILAVRQLTLLYSKVLIPCEEHRVRNAMDSYIQCEQDVRYFDSLRSEDEMSNFIRVANLLFSRSLSKVDSDVYRGQIIPKHGPGSTADGYLGNEKYRQKTWTRRLDRYFPILDFLCPSPSYFEELDDVNILEPEAEIPVKVIPVPKTQKTPRIIAMEPVAMQYAQQGILEKMLEKFDRDNLLSSFLGFDDQSPNQRMAMIGSSSGELATLDLSDASDRVSNQHVRALLSNYPHLRGAVEACRSRKADVPGHGVVRLAKFASMGSALCFPFEAMVFLTMIFMGIEQELGSPLDRRTIDKFRGRVRVYGDDIVVPVDYVYSVISVLEHFGARVNANKSFWIGRFRESCGKEYYEGQDVSIVKVRRVFPTSRKDAPEVISLVSLRNQLYYAGYWGTCKMLDDEIIGLLKHFPIVSDSSPVLGRASFLDYVPERMHEHLHSPLVRGWVVSSRIPHNSVSDSGALLKCFLKRGELPFADRKHLERSGRPRSVDIKARWASPF